MKNQIKTPTLISCITWQRALLSLMFVMLLICNSYGQEDYSERDYGTLITSRNDPFPMSKQDSTIIPCRKLVKADEVFYLSMYVPDISQVRIKPFEQLTVEDKESIITNAWHTTDTTLLEIVFKIALFDTIEANKYIQKLSIESLGRFNTDAVKKILTSLLNDKDVGMTSALSLVQLGQTEQAFQYIQSNYTESVDCNIMSCLVTALVKINTPDAIKLLMKISEHKDPSQALDALAALSLLGYCDFAYKGFCRYVTSNVWQVRTKVANCLLYYIGTPEAINIAKNMYYNEKDHFVVKQFNDVFKKFNIKN